MSLGSTSNEIDLYMFSFFVMCCNFNIIFDDFDRDFSHLWSVCEEAEQQRTANELSNQFENIKQQLDQIYFELYYKNSFIRFIHLDYKPKIQQLSIFKIGKISLTPQSLNSYFETKRIYNVPLRNQISTLLKEKLKDKDLLLLSYKTMEEIFPGNYLFGRFADSPILFVTKQVLTPFSVYLLEEEIAPTHTVVTSSLGTDLARRKKKTHHKNFHSLLWMFFSQILTRLREITTSTWML